MRLLLIPWFCIYNVGGLRFCSAEIIQPQQSIAHPIAQPFDDAKFDDRRIESSLLETVRECLVKTSLDTRSILVPGRGVQDVEDAIMDASPISGENNYMAWNFLQAIAGSDIFVKEFWQKRPLLIRSKDAGDWARGLFTVEKDLRLMDGSFITGYKTAEILRNGTKTDTWALAPLKDNPSVRTVWSDVEKALDGGTIYFNTAGSLWKNLGGLCRLVGYAFGLPPNVNVYVTPPGK